MCKYCKRLKELKDLDDKQFKKIISAWKRRDLVARNLLKWCMNELNNFHVPAIILEHELDEVDLSCCSVSWDYQKMMSKIMNFINTEYVGK